MTARGTTGHFIVEQNTARKTHHVFFTYTYDLLCNIVSTRIIYKLGGRFITVLVYADDFVLIVISWNELQQLLSCLVYSE